MARYSIDRLFGMLHTSTLETSAHSFKEDEPTGATGSAILRPIQYLGSKLRSLDRLLFYTKHLYGANDLVVDCFSGSSVVSQAFANDGARVMAVDSQQFCQHIASAMLGVGRTTDEKSADMAILLAQGFSSLNISGRLGSLLTSELAVLHNGPSSNLVDFYASLPQVWKPSAKEDWFISAQGNVGREGFNFSPIIASHYAGTYFGLRQALFFDYVRNQIHELRIRMEIGEWTETALLTALYSAMSAVVCSAGKHFAQPLATKTTGNPEFRIARLYADRSIDCLQAFISAAKSVDVSSRKIGVGNCAIASPISSIQSQITKLKPALLYADPPYTAQQYSRFYHILEVAAQYKIPELQLIKGRVTSGLYNVNRYKSPYSSKIGAPLAFNSLAEMSRGCGASLAISYSSSSERSTGNSRMISLPDLEKICSKYYGKRIKKIELAHSYRPLNSDEKNNVHRDDPEILIVCEA
jgi:adenine-specific DNA methylase